MQILLRRESIKGIYKRLPVPNIIVRTLVPRMPFLWMDESEARGALLSLGRVSPAVAAATVAMFLALSHLAP